MECDGYLSAAEQCACYRKRVYGLMELVDSYEKLLKQLVDVLTGYLEMEEGTKGTLRPPLPKSEFQPINKGGGT